MATLKQNEATITEANLGFVAQGKALGEIRDKVQFQKGTTVEGQEKITFEDYLAERWDWSRRQADRLITASRVAVMAEKAGFSLANEGQAREVADLFNEPELLTEILAKATEDSKGALTAAAIRKVRHKLAAVARNELGESNSAEADGLEGSLPDGDPNEGEDWEAVLKAARTTTRKLVRETPDNWQSALATMLEDVAAQARKKAIRIAKAGA